MINNFQVGGVVKGSSFIGRKELIRQYKKQLLKKSRSSSISIRGITRIGKTSFVQKVFDHLPDSFILCDINMKIMTSYYELWLSVMEPIHDYLEKNNSITQEVIDFFKIIEDKATPWIRFVRTVKRVFSYLSEKKLKCIIILDEFDYATEIFESKTPRYELFRSIISDANFNITAILISRKSLHEIEGQTFQSSTFKGVFDARYFKGFNSEDLDEYYKVFEHKRIHLSVEQKKEIDYYAGNSPYLLSIIGNRILEAKRNNKEIDIAEIFRNDCKQINEYYADILAHLTRDGVKDKLVSFVLGPNVGVTRSDKDELLNLGYLREVSSEVIPISKYFADYLRNNKVEASIWENLTITEKKIKILLDKEFMSLKVRYRITENNKNLAQKAILDKITSISVVSISNCLKTIRANKRDWNLETSYFDALNLKDSFNIIKDNWTIFNKYFNNETLTSWEQKFEIIGKARNPPAHAHEEYLPNSIKQEVDVYCNNIQHYIANAYKNISEPSSANTVSSDNLKTVEKSQCTETNLVRPETKLNKFTGIVIEKFVNDRYQFFVKQKDSQNEYFIYPKGSVVYSQLAKDMNIQFELQGFADSTNPNAPKLNFAVNYSIIGE